MQPVIEAESERTGVRTPVEGVLMREGRVVWRLAEATQVGREGIVRIRGGVGWESYWRVLHV
jgi:hypothetical protein